MKKDIVLIGGGGHCHAVIDVIETTGLFNIVGILDKPELHETHVLGYKVIGNDSDIPKLIEKYQHFVITVGHIKNANTRIELYNKVKSVGGTFPTIISPLSHIGKGATIGDGTVIMHHALINANVKLGINNIINTKALIEHDTVINHHNHISTNTVINGNCIIKNATFIGSGTIVNQGIKIVSNAIVGAMSLVNRNIDTRGTYTGIPIKMIK
ncbi:acetyltransferase [Reichenbachiella carrageenanivorans]|uniref:Acetyltransferase n=1 Tax=Reichenbachiella carrageenanivorans TaxID=2979869 RepID=A0ABY6D378_9BACT|nr:acetyltransferase [Reichenbachiella carrageenanivorans]UXX80606.1 acetyltransferase [Reichenbachiella carrageenanivorans]